MAKRKVKLADVLWEAANQYLWCGDISYWLTPPTISRYSCCAVYEALEEATQSWAWMDEIQTFLRSLGCPITSEVATLGTQSKRERQKRRYMWLLLAMHVAEDENIYIEVER